MLRILFSLICAGRLLAVPAAPGLQQGQIDGQDFQYKMLGDEFCNWAQTVEGASLLMDGDGAWRFAEQDQTGALLPGSTLYHPSAEIPAASMNARPSQNWIRENILPRRALLNQGAQRRERVDGTWNLLLIMIHFPDQNPNIEPAGFDAMMNEAGYNGTGSFNDYYEDLSYGRYSTVSTVTQWYTAENEHDWYGYNQGYDRSQYLVREAVLAADADVDFSQFDNSGNGVVDGLLIVHSGHGAEEGDQTNIWSHRWALWGQAIDVDGVMVSDYTMQPEMQGGSQSAIGVYVHEFGHNLGLPDLYDTDYSSTGVGTWCVMASGSWGGGAAGSTAHFPVRFSAWCRQFLGWTSTTETDTELIAYELESSTQSDEVIRLDLPEAQQYFLAEYRDRTGWDRHQHAAGLLVYHIDEGQSGNSQDFHYLVDVEQADGMEDLNRGYGADGGDCFPGSTNNRLFDSRSEPSSLPYFGDTSQLSIGNIQDPEDVLVADFFQLFSHQFLVCGEWDLTEDSSGNDWPDAGDSIGLAFQVENSGATVDSLWLSLSCPGGELDLEEQEFLLLDVPSGNFMTPGFSAWLPEELEAAEINLLLHSRDSRGWEQESPCHVQVGRAELLVVADGAPAELLDFYELALSPIMASLELRSRDSQALAYTDLDEYPGLIWFTAAGHNELDNQELLALEEYVSQGGRLILSGQHLLDGHEDVFGISEGTSVNGSPMMAGLATGGLVFDEELILLTGAMGAGNQEMPAVALHSDNPDHEALMAWQAGGQASAYRMDGPEGRVIVCGFSLEAMHGISAPFVSREMLMERAWLWLNDGVDTGIDEPALQAASFSVRAWPNPFNPSTTLEITLTQPDRLRMSLYNMRGQLLSEQDLGSLASGLHRQNLQLGDAASGSYLVKVEGKNTGSRITRILLLR